MQLLKIFQKKGKGKTGLSLSLEGFQALVDAVEDKELRTRLPNPAQKKVLEISPRHQPLSMLLKERGAKQVVRVGSLREKEKAPPVPHVETFILSHWENLPLLEASTDLIILRSVFMKGMMGRVLRESSRVLDKGGELLLVDMHPFSLLVQREHLKSAVSEEGGEPGFERYWKWFREAGLSVEWVKEIFFEGAQKKFLTTEAQKHDFDMLRRTPFLILFLLRKGAS